MFRRSLRPAISALLLVLPMLIATYCALFYADCTMHGTSGGVTMAASMDCCLSCLELAAQERTVKPRLNINDPQILYVQDWPSVITSVQHPPAMLPLPLHPYLGKIPPTYLLLLALQI